MLTIILQDICLNGKFIAIRTGDDRILLRSLEEFSTKECNKFTGNDGISLSCKTVSCFAMTNDFLIYATAHGTIAYFHLETKTLLSECEHEHSLGITAIAPNSSGTAVVFRDESDQGFLFHPILRQVIRLQEFPTNSSKIFWDKSYTTMFFVFDGVQLHTFSWISVSVYGPKVCKFKLEKNEGDDTPSHIYPICNELVPITSLKGKIICQSVQDEQIVEIKSPTYDDMNDAETGDSFVQFSRNIALFRLEKAFKYATVLNLSSCWKSLAERAMEMLNINLATRVCQQMGDAAMVEALEALDCIEDRNLLAGHVAIILKDYDLAQKKFITSSFPYAALEMRRDLRHWTKALLLAEELFPREVMNISISLAQELELVRDFKGSLHILERAMVRINDTEDHSRFNNKDIELCQAGIARSFLHIGDINNGVHHAKKINDVTLFCQCADIIKNQDEREAALLYSLGGQIGRAHV